MSEQHIIKINWDTATVDEVRQFAASAENENGDFPLHLAAMHSRNPDLITRLISAGEDITALDRFVETPDDIARERRCADATLQLHA